METRKLLVATDFSPASERALEVAQQLAKSFDAQLAVLHVLEPPPYPYAVAQPESVRLTASGALDRATEAVRRVRTERLLREGSPSVEIAGAAEETGSGLVILGTHGHRGLAYLMLGSVAEKVVRLSSVPVLTVPPWRYADRRAAGQDLARSLQSIRGQRPLVVALSRGAISIGREVAKAFETSLDVLLVRQIECDGRPLGAVAEDGTALTDEEAVSRSALDRKAMETIVEAARESCRDESILLRGARWIIDISNRTVVLVSEGATSEWPTAVAAAMCRSMGARRIVAAAPAVSAAVVPAMARHVDEIACVERVQDPAAIAMLYRDRREPSDREAVDLLAAAATAQ